MVEQVYLSGNRRELARIESKIGVKTGHFDVSLYKIYYNKVKNLARQNFSNNTRSLYLEYQARLI